MTREAVKFAPVSLVRFVFGFIVLCASYTALNRKAFAQDQATIDFGIYLVEDDKSAEYQVSETGTVPDGYIWVDGADDEPAQLLVLPAIINASDVKTARAGLNSHWTDRPVVNFKFTTLGARKFAEFTTEYTGRQFAIVSKDEIISSPRVNAPIVGGAGYIEGDFTVVEAEQLACDISPPSLMKRFRCRPQNNQAP